MMELMTILLLMLAGWIQKSDTTDCTLHVSPQPLRFNLLCPDTICRLEIQPNSTMGCSSISTRSSSACYIDDCNTIYHICNTTQSLVNTSSEFSPTRNGEQLGGEQIIHNNEQPINCTFSVFNEDIIVRCQKGECRLTARSSITICSRDLGLGINCDPGNPATCYRKYNLCTPHPTVCESLRSETTTSGMNSSTQTCPECTSEICTTEHNQCNKTVTVQSCTNEVTVTIHSVKSVYTSTTVYKSVCPSPTTSLTSQRKTTNVFNISCSTNTRYLSPSTCSPALESATMPLNIVLPAAGVLVGLLVVLLLLVCTGWVCTCRAMKKKGGITFKVTQDSFPNRPNTNDTTTHVYTETWRRFDDPLCTEQKQTSATAPPQTKPKPPQRLREEPVYAISLVTNKRDNREPKNIQNGANRILPGGGGVSVGVASQIPRLQGVCDHEYDHLVKVVKQKGNQGKRDERVDSEREHTYHVLEGSGNDYDDLDDQEEGNDYRILEGPTPVEEEPKYISNGASQVLSGGGVSVGVASQISEHQYDKLIKIVKHKGGQSKRDETAYSEREHTYHVLEGSGNDYDDLDDQGGNDYHILEGPTPVEEET